MHSTVKRKDACEYSKKQLQYLLPKELLKQRMTASSQVKIDIVPFKEWINAILTVTKTNTLLQGSDGGNKSGEISRLPLKNRMHKIGLPKTLPFLISSCCRKLSVLYIPERIHGCSCSGKTLRSMK